MRGIDIIVMALKNLWKRRLRTFLTVLGVVIGTASIVVMISIGIGMNESYKMQLEEMGSLQVINVRAPYGSDFAVMSIGGSNNKSKNKALDNKAIEAFKKLPYVEAVSPIIDTYMTISTGKLVNEVNIRGIDPATMETMGIKVAQGRPLQEGDSMTFVMGSYASEQFYNPKLNWRMRWENMEKLETLGEKLKITFDNNYGTNDADKKVKPYNITVVGQMEGYSENSYNCYMPIKDLQKIKAEQEKYENSKNKNSNNNKKKTNEYQNVMVKVSDMKKVKEVQETIKEMGYEASSLTEWLEEMQKTSKGLQNMLGAIGAVSLFVAAIGITNTMVMSIYERTREIGVMKVIGASLGDIQKLFLTEAAFIGFMGGVLGLLLSIGISTLLNMSGGDLTGMGMGNGGTTSLIPLWLNLSALGFATVVGVAAGYFPARRAMKLSALSAIKTD